MVSCRRTRKAKRDIEVLGTYSRVSVPSKLSIEDPPGWREGTGMRLYLAYLRDTDGNKICAMHRG